MMTTLERHDKPPDKPPAPQPGAQRFLDEVHNSFRVPPEGLSGAPSVLKALDSQTHIRFQNVMEGNTMVIPNHNIYGGRDNTGQPHDAHHHKHPHHPADSAHPVAAAGKPAVPGHDHAVPPAAPAKPGVPGHGHDQPVGPAQPAKPAPPGAPAQTPEQQAGAILSGTDQAHRDRLWKDAAAILKATDQGQFHLFADKNAIDQVLQGRTQAERLVIDKYFQQQNPNGHASLETEMKKFEGNGDLARFENALHYKDNNDASVNSGRIMESLADGGNLFGRSQEQLDLDIRTTLSTHNAAQIADMAREFKSTTGINLADAIQHDPHVKDDTKQAAAILLKGNDKLTDQDNNALIRISINSGNHDLFDETITRASDAVKANFRANGVGDKDRFGKPLNGDAEMVRAFDNNPFDGSALNSARDYLKEGHLDTATKISENSGIDGVFANKQAIQLAITQMSDKEKSDYRVGRELAQGQHVDNLTPQAHQDAVNTYTRLHTAIAGSGDATQQATFENQILGDGGALASQLATHRHLWTGLMADNAADVSHDVQHMTEADWNHFKQDPAARSEIQSVVASLHEDPADVAKIMNVFDQKMKANTWAEAQEAGRESIVADLQHVGRTGGQDRHGAMVAISEMTAQDRQKYRTDANFRQQVDGEVKVLFGTITSNGQIFDNASTDAAQAMLAQVAAGKTPTMGLAQDLSIRTLNLINNKTDVIGALKDALQNEPGLRDRLKNPNDPTSKLLHQVLNNDDYQQFAKPLIDGHNLSIAADMTLDRNLIGANTQSVYRDMATATPQEKQRLQTDSNYRDQVLSGLDQDHRDIAMNVLKQGATRPEDSIRDSILGFGGSDEIVAAMRAIKPQDMAAVEQAYEDKYHHSFRGDLMAKLGSDDKREADRLLTRTESVDAQLADTARQVEQANSGIYVPGATASAADDALNRLDTAAAAADLSPHPAAAAVSAFEQDRGQTNQAVDDQIKAKAAPIDTVVTGVTMVGGTIAVGALTVGTGGADLGVIALVTAGAAASGAVVEVGTKKLILGDDYDPNATELTTDLAKGAVIGATSTIGIAGSGEVAEGATATFTSGLVNNMSIGGAAGFAGGVVDGAAHIDTHKSVSENAERFGTTVSGSTVSGMIGGAVMHVGTSAFGAAAAEIKGIMASDVHVPVPDLIPTPVPTPVPTPEMLAAPNVALPPPDVALPTISAAPAEVALPPAPAPAPVAEVPVITQAAPVEQLYVDHQSLLPAEAGADVRDVGQGAIAKAGLDSLQDAAQTHLASVAAPSASAAPGPEAASIAAPAQVVPPPAAGAPTAGAPVPDASTINTAVSAAPVEAPAGRPAAPAFDAQASSVPEIPTIKGEPSRFAVQRAIDATDVGRQPVQFEYGGRKFVVNPGETSDQVLQRVYSSGPYQTGADLIGRLDAVAAKTGSPTETIGITSLTHPQEINDFVNQIAADPQKYPNNELQNILDNHLEDVQPGTQQYWRQAIQDVQHGAEPGAAVDAAPAALHDADAPARAADSSARPADTSGRPADDQARAADAPEVAVAAAAERAVPPPHDLTQEQVDSLWNQLASQDGVFHFQKGYYEAHLTHVDAAENPNGIIFSSSEKGIMVASDLTLPNGQVITAGTRLPNGVRLSPGEVSEQNGVSVLTGVKLETPPEGVRMPDGSTLNSTTLDTVSISGGAKAAPDSWIINRASTDDAGAPRIDTYAQTDATMQSKWVPVPDKPGVYSPNIATAKPVEMVKLPDDMRVKFMASYKEEVSNETPAYLVKSGDGQYIITERDLRETYIGSDAAGDARINSILDQASAQAGARVPFAARPAGMPPLEPAAEAPPSAALERPAAASPTHDTATAAADTSGRPADTTSRPADDQARAADAPEATVAAAAERAVPPIHDLTQDQVNNLWSEQASQDGVFHFQKGYYEANLTHVDAAENPNGIIFSSSEKGITMASDLTLPTGQVITAGTRLPNGVRLSPGQFAEHDGVQVLTGVKLETPPEGVRMPDGSTLNSTTLDTINITGGAKAAPDSWIINRASTDDAGAPRIDTYAQTTAKMQSKWVPVPDKPGVYSPNLDTAEPVEMVKIPDGMRVKFNASYNEEVSNETPAYLVKDGSGQYIITERDLRETYIGSDAAADTRMNSILDQASAQAGARVPQATRPARMPPVEAPAEAQPAATLERPAGAAAVAADSAAASTRQIGSVTETLDPQGRVTAIRSQDGQDVFEGKDGVFTDTRTDHKFAMATAADGSVVLTGIDGNPLGLRFDSQGARQAFDARLGTWQEAAQHEIPSSVPASAPVTDYIKSAPVKAERLSEPLTWTNPDNGERIVSPAGAVKIYKPDGSFYVSDEAHFNRSYYLLPGFDNQYVKLAGIKAQQLDGPAIVQSSGSGVTAGVSGDYLISRTNPATGEVTSQEILPKRVFEAEFTPSHIEAPEAAASLELMNLPKTTQPVIDMGAGVTSQDWERGSIIKNSNDGTVSVIDNSTNTTNIYKDNRLVERVQKVGDQQHATYYFYDQAEQMASVRSIDTVLQDAANDPRMQSLEAQELSRPNSNTDQSPEAKARRLTQAQQYYQELAANAPPGRDLWIVLGPPGAGKSVVLKPITEEHGAILSDADYFNAKLSPDGIGHMSQSEEAGYMAKYTTLATIRDGHSAALAMVGGGDVSHLEATLQLAKDNGMTTHIIYVDTPQGVAAENVMKRSLRLLDPDPAVAKTGQFAQPAYVRSVGSMPRQNYEHLKSRLGDLVDSYQTISNYGFKGRTVESGSVDSSSTPQ